MRWPFFLVLLSGLAFGQTAKYQNWCEVGNKSIVVQGLGSATKAQATLTDCAITVYLHGSTNTAVLYRDESNTPLGNPFSANSDGSFAFYASTSSHYDVTMIGDVVCVPNKDGCPSNGTETIINTISDVILGGSGGGGGSTVYVNGTLVSSPNFVAGPNASVVASGSTVTISASGGGGAGNPGSPVNSVQGNLAGSFYGISGLYFTPPSGASYAQVTADNINNVITVTPDFAFSACASGCTYTTSGATTLTAGSNTVTITPFPVGVNGSDNNHYLMITPAAGDTSPTDIIMVAGGTGTSGATSGTLTFTAHFAYIAGYKIQSATSGITEAGNLCTSPGCTVKLVPHTSYYCNAPAYISPHYISDVTFDGQWATIWHNSIGPCLVMGEGAWNTGGQANSWDVSHFDMRPSTIPWSVQPSGSLDGTTATATLTIPTCPSGFYAAIPNQLLWIAGTYNGVNTTVYGYGEFVMTQAGGTCTPGATNGTVVIGQATAGVTNLSPHSNGYTLSSNVGPYIESTVSINGHIHDIRFASNTNQTAKGDRIQIDVDQACAIDNIDAQGGYSTRNDSDFQAASIFSPGAVGYPICFVHNLTHSSGAKCIEWWGGNDLSWDTGICQNYSEAGLMVGNKRGGYGQFQVGPGVHFEQGGFSPIFGQPVGVPTVIMNGGYRLTGTGSYSISSLPVQLGSGGSWPYFREDSSSTHAQFYYLVGRNNAAANCTSGECYTVPVMIGVADVDDPSVNNVSVHWAGWGLGGANNAATWNQTAPTSYDLLVTTVNSRYAAYGNVPSSIPSGTSTWAVATGLLPSDICDLHNLCTFVDNVAPASRTSYTVNSNFSKAWAPYMLTMPGPIAIAAALTTTSGVVLFHGAYTCINSMTWNGYAIAETNTRQTGVQCPPTAGTVNDATGTLYTVAFTSTNLSADVVNIAGMKPGAHCTLTPTNASAATNVASTYVSAKGTGTVTITHPTTAGMTFDLVCTPN